MEIDFDSIVDRKNTNSSKYDEAFKLYKREDLDILSVADMEFCMPNCVKNAIKNKVEKGILGYTSLNDEYFEAYIKWYKKRYGYIFDMDCMVHTPGVVSAIRMFIQTFTKENDKILIFEPVYASFKRVIDNTKRVTVVSELINTKDGFRIDFEDFSKKIKDVVAVIVCNPHNPIGRSWTKEEIKKIADICRENNTMVISDEIHADLTLFSNKHHIFRKYYENTVSFISPTKTFNLSGVQTSVCVLPNKEMAIKYYNCWRAFDIYRPNAIAVEAVIEGYGKGEIWLENLKKYIEANLLYIDKFLKKNLPNIKFHIPEATYLCFIDFNNLNISEDELNKLLVEKAKLVVVLGSVFGKSGTSFIRLNAACSRKKLEKVLNNLLKVLVN